MPFHKRWRAMAGLIAAALLCLLSPTLSAPAAAAELVMFDQASCHYCKQWLAEVGPAYSRSPIGRRAPLRRVDVRAQRGLGLRVPVHQTPTFVLLDRGREVGRIAGYSGAEYFWGAMRDMVQKLPAPSPAATKGRLALR